MSDTEEEEVTNRIVKITVVGEPSTGKVSISLILYVQCDDVLIKWVSTYYIFLTGPRSETIYHV